MMRLITLKRDTLLSALAISCGICEKELMEMNGLERSALLPCGMSLILPSVSKEAEQKTELFVSYTGLDGELIPSAAVVRANIFSPGAHKAPGGTLPMLAVSNEDEQGYISPELAHRLFMDESTAEEAVAALAAKLGQEGWGGLLLNMEYLFPFDRAAYTYFAKKLEKAVHCAGCWLIVSLPAEAVLRPHSRSGSAYDIAALSSLCERVIVTCEDIWTGQLLENCVSGLSALAPAEKVLLALKSQGLVRRGTEKSHMQSAAVHNLAVSAGARIYREAEGFPAQFDFTDAAGQPCHARYTDAHWLAGILRRLSVHSLAGILCEDTAGLCPGGKHLFESNFKVETFI